jgi:hypothetical protein
MNFDIQEINKHVVSSDTDSMFVNFEPILKKLYPTLDLTSIPDTLPKAKALQTELRPILNDYQSVIAKSILNSDDHYFDLKPEFILQSAYWSGKRRYAQWQVDKEGIPIEKLVVMGLDITKSNFPPYFRGFGEEIIRKILFATDKKEVDKFLIEFRDSINGVDWKKLCKPTGIKKIGEYIASPPPQGKIFSTLQKKAPPNTKGSIRYNDLIKYHKLDQEYPQIQLGDKIYLTYLKKNPYMIDMIALKGEGDPPFITELVEEYIDKDKLFSTILYNKIEKIYQDLNYGSPVFNSYIADYFSFS